MKLSRFNLKEKRILRESNSVIYCIKYFGTKDMKKSCVCLYHDGKS